LTIQKKEKVPRAYESLNLTLRVPLILHSIYMDIVGLALALDRILEGLEKKIKNPSLKVTILLASVPSNRNPVEGR
jgi:hypothetical protein